MSALGGVLMFGDAPVDPQQLVALGARLDRLGPDGGREVVAGPVGMTYRAFHTNAESRREHQPYCREHRTVICWDGRLDNREELQGQLRDELRGEDTDVAIAMAAYLRWHRDGIAKLVGDFALAIWDERDHAVWLARDCVGTRTLYYHVDRERVLWSTDLGALLDISGVSIEVNDEYVAGFLTRGPEPGLTPYVGVHAVKPAHVVRVDEDGLVSEQRFWALDPKREIRYRTDAEYEEHFRAVFREAVRVRLRSDRPVFAELSGGLDSSSIVCVAHHILQSGDAASPELETVSYVFDDAPTSDERKWIRFVEEHRGRDGHHVFERTHRYLTPSREISEMAAPSVRTVASAYDCALVSVMAKTDARVLLSGFGGDHVMWNSHLPTPELAELAANWQLLQLVRSLRIWSGAFRIAYPRLFWTHAVTPNLPGWLRLAERHFDPAPWLAPEFVESHRAALRPRTLGGPKTLGSVGFREQAAMVAAAVALVAAGHRQEAMPHATVYPNLHRPLVDFMLAIPFDQKLRPGQTRSLQRRALALVLPAPTRDRAGKGNPSEITYRSIARQHVYFRDLLRHAHVVARRYVDEHQLRAALDRAAAGGERRSAALVRTLALELWLRAVEQRRGATSTVPLWGGMHPHSGARGSGSLAPIPGASEGTGPCSQSLPDRGVGPRRDRKEAVHS